MKTLYLVRHAKSSWDNAHLSDFERPLNERGQRDAPAMAERLRQRGELPGLLVSSPALRARTTAETFAEAFAIDPSAIVERMSIYEGGAQELLGLIWKLPAEESRVMLFGHNPVLSQLAHLLGDRPTGSLPTCSVVRIDFTAADWSGITPGGGRTAWHDYPKKGEENG